MSSTILPLGTKVSGTIAELQRYYATVQLDGQLGMAPYELRALRVTAAMAAGVTDKLWEIGDVVKVSEDWEAA